MKIRTLALASVVALAGLASFLCVPAQAYTVQECESPGVAGTCRMSCNTGENEVGTCSDAKLQVTCCSKKTIPQGGSLTPTPASSTGSSGPALTQGNVGSVTVGSPITLFDPLKGKGIFGVLNAAVRIFLGFIGSIALLVFIYSGVLYMTAGTSDRVKEAMEAMKYAVLGLIIIMLAYIISSYFITTLTTNPNATKPKKKTSVLWQNAYRPAYWQPASGSCLPSAGQLPTHKRA